MTPICTILIASRKRPDGLERALDSVFSTTTPGNIEVIVRIDNDDHPTIARVANLAYLYGFTTIIGPREQGYRSLGDFFTQMSSIAKGRWIAAIDDDSFYMGPPGWDAQLLEVPTTGFVATAEQYWLGRSRYPDCHPVGWFVPNQSWAILGVDGIGMPPDVWIREFFEIKHGWKQHVLKGLILNHQRDEHDAAFQERGATK